MKAEIVERDAMRYSPAGVPIMSAKLSHASQQEEAGVLRVVALEINALAAGEIASTLEQLPMAQAMLFRGFLAHRSRHGKSLVFHIIEISTCAEGV